jgi:hypothetical protein
MEGYENKITVIQQNTRHFPFLQVPETSAQALTSSSVLLIDSHQLLCPSIDEFQEFVGSLATLHSCLPFLLINTFWVGK